MDALSRLQALIRAELGAAAKIQADTVAKDVPGWDSGAMVAILFALEDEFALTLTSGEMESVRGVADLLRLVADKATC